MLPYYRSDINECQMATTHKCDHHCTDNTPNYTNPAEPAYICSCREGYLLQDDKRSCQISKFSNVCLYFGIGMYFNDDIKSTSKPAVFN